VRSQWQQLHIHTVLNSLVSCYVGVPLLTRADLAREISKEIPDVKVDFMRASSYGAASESSGAVQVSPAAARQQYS